VPALALLGRWRARVPHEVVGDQLSAALERIDQRDWTVRADQPDGGIDLHHLAAVDERQRAHPLRGAEANRPAVSMREREGLIARIRQIRRVFTEAD
jgi:hypothetical protein